MDYVTAYSADGTGFILFKDGTWRTDSSCVQNSATFRSNLWGASINEVKNSELAELIHEESGRLGYSAAVANHEVIAVYTFIEDKLVMGRYVFQQEHASKQAYLHDFWGLKNLLIEKYGSPLASDAFWSDDLYQDNVDEWGMAVSCGHVSFFEQWDIDGSHIELQLYGDNYEVNLSIMYQSISLKGLLERQQKKSALSGL